MQLFHISFTNQTALDGHSHGHVISNYNTKTVLVSLFLEALYFWSEMKKNSFLIFTIGTINIRRTSGMFEQGVAPYVIDVNPDVV